MAQISPMPGTFQQVSALAQQVVVATAGLVHQQYIPDAQRNTLHHPGRLIYSAQFDHEKLKCLYMAMTFPFCCGLEKMARETHYDVYSNAVVLSRPSFFVHNADCCTGRPAWGLTTYYDHPTFDEATSGNHHCGGDCFTLMGYLGKFGDQLNHHNRCCNCNPRSGLSHYTYHASCQTVEQVYGLVEGEGARLSAMVNIAKTEFRTNLTNYQVDVNALPALALIQAAPPKMA